MGKSIVEYWFDPFENLGLKGEAKEDALQEAADLLLESILSDVADGKSPVTGRKFKQLNKDYAEKEHGGDRNARLELSGGLLSGLIVRPSDGGILVTVAEDEQEKADGHNNHSGDSLLPERRFIPKADDNQFFRPEIRKSIIEIGKDFLDDTTDEE